MNVYQAALATVAIDEAIMALRDKVPCTRPEVVLVDLFSVTKRLRQVATWARLVRWQAGDPAVAFGSKVDRLACFVEALALLEAAGVAKRIADDVKALAVEQASECAKTLRDIRFALAPDWARQGGYDDLLRPQTVKDEETGLWGWADQRGEVEETYGELVSRVKQIADEHLARCRAQTDIAVFGQTMVEQDEDRYSGLNKHGTGRGGTAADLTD